MVRRARFLRRDPVSSGDGLSFNPHFRQRFLHDASHANLIAISNPLIERETLPTRGSLDNPNGYIQEWSLNIEQELTSNLVLKAIYLGSAGNSLS